MQSLIVLFVAILVTQVVSVTTRVVSSTATPADREQLKQPRREIDTTKMHVERFITTTSVVYDDPIKGVEYPWFGRTKITFFDYCNMFTVSCGASLIYKDIAVTSANCIADYISNFPGYAYTIDIYFGATNYSGVDGITHAVKKVIYPSDYNYPNNDIAFYKLYVSTNVTPVSWNMDPLIPSDGSNVTTIGFDLASNSTLRKVNLKTISNTQCAIDLPQNIVPDTSTCAYAPEKDLCLGDSGSPITTMDGSLYGVTSFRLIGDLCGASPIGYTRTSSQTQFMSEVICNYSAYPPSTCPSTETTNDGKKCGIFGLSVLCPFTLGGLIGRLLGRIFGF